MKQHLAGGPEALEESKDRLNGVLHAPIRIERESRLAGPDVTDRDGHPQLSASRLRDGRVGGRGCRKAALKNGSSLAVMREGRIFLIAAPRLRVCGAVAPYGARAAVESTPCRPSPALASYSQTRSPLTMEALTNGFVMPDSERTAQSSAVDSFPWTSAPLNALPMAVFAAG